MRILRLNNATRGAKDNDDDMMILLDEIDVDAVDFAFITETWDALGTIKGNDNLCV